MNRSATFSIETSCSHPSAKRLTQSLVLVAGALSIASCTMPREQAWQKIKSDGLIPYFAYEIKARKQVHPSQIPPLLANKPTPAPARTSLDIPELVKTSAPIPGLPGFVRSPYTNPPRLVKIDTVTPGQLIFCPYTHRPFRLTSPPVDDPSAPVLTQQQKASIPPPAIASHPSVLPAPAPELEAKPIPQPATAPQAPVTPVQAPSPAAVAKTDPPPAQPSVGAPPSPQPVVAAPEIPFAKPIPDRPGFVYSPFADTNQIVDVAGMTAGSKVRCPYTGNIFRVPNEQTMSTLKPDQPVILSSPKTPEKK